MSKNESFLIDTIRHHKDGNREFILWRMAEDSPEPWVAAIGNKQPSLTLGESLPDGVDGVEFLAYGASAEEALERLLAELDGNG